MSEADCRLALPKIGRRKAKSVSDLRPRIDGVLSVLRRANQLAA